MVPKVNAAGHLPAHTAFTGRIANFAKDAPYAFGTAGFLQRASGPTSNSAAPRGDYCIWLGTTHNLAGTHRCLNIDTLREITGDTFRPSILTESAILRLTHLSGQSLEPLPPPTPIEQVLDNPTPSYPLDPNRGVEPHNIVDVPPTEIEIVSADAVTDLAQLVQFEGDASDPVLLPDLQETTALLVDDSPERALTQAKELVELRNSINQGYSLHNALPERRIFTALTMKEARSLYGDALVDAASMEELKNCIQKDVWECLDPQYKPIGAIPSKIFLTP